MPLINLERVLVKSTTACRYRSNESLGASVDFGELGLIAFSNKLFLSSYVYYFKDWAKILSRLVSDEHLKLRETEKKTSVGCVTLTLELFPGGQGEGI